MARSSLYQYVPTAYQTVTEATEAAIERGWHVRYFGPGHGFGADYEDGDAAVLLRGKFSLEYVCRNADGKVMYKIYLTPMEEN